MCLFFLLFHIIAAEVRAIFNNGIKWIKKSNLCTISMKMLGINSGNPILVNCKWDKISESIVKYSYLEESKTYFERWNDNIVSFTNSFIQIAVHRPYLYYSKLYQKKYPILSGTEKIQPPPRHLAQIPIWMIGLGFLDIETQSNTLKMKWI